jgi:hypothetical protein
MHNFYLKEPPQILKVIEEIVTIKDGVRKVEYKQIDPSSNVDGLDVDYQTLVDSSLKTANKKEVDEKVKVEKLERENADLKARFEALEAKLTEKPIEFIQDETEKPKQMQTRGRRNKK